MKQKKQSLPTACWRSLQILFLFFVPLLLQAQGGNQWTTTIKVGGTNNLADWVYDIITTDEKNYFAVGFAKENEDAANSRPDVPAYFLLSPNGTLLGDGFIEIPSLENPANTARGRLFNVVEGTDAYFAVGCVDIFNSFARGILVKVDKTTLAAQHWEVLPTGYTSGRLADIAHVSAGSDNYLLVTGWANDGTGRKNWIAAYNYDGTLRSTGSSLHEFVTAAPGEPGAIVHDIAPDGKVRVYTASAVPKSESSGTPALLRRDRDIQVNVTTYDPSSAIPFTAGVPIEVNSITSRTYTAPNANGPLTVAAGDVFDDHPPQFPSGQYDKYPYGPKYLGTSFARGFSNCNEQAPVPDLLYVEDWSDGSDDLPQSMVKSGNRIVVSALLNRLIMWGSATGGNNDALGGDTDSGLRCSPANDPCFHYDSYDYYWGEGYLLFFDLDANGNPTGLGNATYLATMSGGDFIPKVIQTSDGGFAVSGTVTGCPDGLDAVEGAEHMMVIKTDADGNVIWREHYNGPGEGACGFAITETPDGGIIIAGNTEDGEEEDFCIIKLGSDCDYGTATVLPNSGNDYLLAANEIWDTDRSVKARVVVPAGIVLTIQGTTAAKTTVRFADSKEVFGFKERYPIGITVQRGGKLVTSNAILTGFDCSGTPKMWDGINVEGNPGLPQTNANQGFATFLSSDVLHARQGSVTAAVWCGEPAPIQSNYAGTGSQGLTYTSALYHGGPFGGGKIFGINSRWIDNKRSAIFMKYQHNLDKSWFLNCDFLSNGPLVDPNEMLAPIPNDFNYNEARGTQIHVSIWSTKVQFSSCDFQGSTSIIPDYRPFGIEGDDPKIVASTGNMKDLKIGIECRSPLGSILGTVNATGITLDNVVQGINLRNSTADKITGCHFLNIPTPNTFQGLSPVGIFGKFNKGAEIRGNDFHGADASNPTWGIVEHNTLNQGCEIRENQFFNARVGNQFEGSNSALIARCNDYTDMGFSGWAAVKNANAGTLPPQGNPAPGFQKADNEFFDLCDGSADIHIFSEFAFAYFDKTGNPHPADEDCVSDIVNLVIVPDPSPLSCGTIDPPCDPPCRLAQYYASPGTIRDRNTAIRGLIHTGFDSEGADLPAQYESALSLLQYRNQPEDQILRIGSLASMDRLTEALAANNALSNSTTEGAAYKTYLSNILSAGTDLTALPAANYNTAMMSLTSENVSTRAMAENLQYFREGIYHPLVAIDPEGGEGGRPSSGRHEAKSLGQALDVQVSPNPFYNEVVFDFGASGTDAKYHLTITDLMARVILSQQLGGGLSFRWQTGQVPDGQYLYQVRTDKGLVQNGKLLKVKK